MPLVPTLLAHGDIPGLGDWVNGALHPLRSPSHALLLVALGLLLGQARPPRWRWTGTALAAGAAAGMTLASALGIESLHPAWLLAPAMLVAAAAAFEAPAPAWAMAAVAGLAALALGLDSAPDTAGAWKAGVATAVALPVIAIDLAFYASLAGPAWARVGLRVVASWVVAVSVLVLAFELKAAAGG